MRDGNGVGVTRYRGGSGTVSYLRSVHPCSVPESLGDRGTRRVDEQTRPTPLEVPSRRVGSFPGSAVGTRRSPGPPRPEPGLLGPLYVVSTPRETEGVVTGVPETGSSYTCRPWGRVLVRSSLYPLTVRSLVWRGTESKEPVSLFLV